MGDEPRFSEKWDIRRQENNFDDSSSDDPDSYSTHEPFIHNPNPVLDSNHLDNGTKPVTREEPVKARKRRSKKDESKPEKAKQVRRRKPNINGCAEEKEETVMENQKKEESGMEMDDVGIFMKALLDDLTASRESLMDWMDAELNGSSDQNVASRPPPEKRAVAAGSVKKRKTKKKAEEEEKQKKQEEVCLEMNKHNEKSSEVGQNGGDQVQELDYNAGPSDMFLRSGHGSLGRIYRTQEEQDQTEMENATGMNKKSVVLAIEAPKVRQRQKKTREANTIKNISETTKDDNFAIPYVPQLSSSPSLQSFPFFPASSQGVTCLASNNNNYEPMQPPVLPQFCDLSEFQTGFTGGQGFGNSLFQNNGYFSGFPAAFRPNLMAQVNPTTYSQQKDNNNMFGGLQTNPTTYSQQRANNSMSLQMNPTIYSQQRDNKNMFGELQMAGGAIPYSASRFHESEVSNGNNSLPVYRTSSGRYGPQ